MAEGGRGPCLPPEPPAAHYRRSSTSSSPSPFPSSSQSSGTPLSFLSVESSRNWLVRVLQHFASPPPCVSLSFPPSVPPLPSLPFVFLLHVLLSFSPSLHPLGKHHFTFLCLLRAPPSLPLHTLFLPHPLHPSFAPPSFHMTASSVSLCSIKEQPDAAKLERGEGHAGLNTSFSPLCEPNTPATLPRTPPVQAP